MNILIGCEFSGTVRNEFLKFGHNTWPCDILPSLTPGPHLQTDIRDVIKSRPKFWDIAIFFPPCTYLCNGGMNWKNRQPGRLKKIDEAIDFFLDLTKCNIPRTCIENPPGIMSTLYKKPSQIIEPYYFGDKYRKPTCLWLKNLPPLHCPGIFHFNY